MPSARFLALVPLLLCVFAQTAAAAGDEHVPAGPHHLGASLGLGATLASADDDGHWREGSAAPGFALDYAYAVAPILDVGANVRYWNFGAFSNTGPDTFNHGEDGIHHGLAPGVIVRLHTTTLVELGATFGIGALFLEQRVPDSSDQLHVRSHTWLGVQTSVSLDARYWVTPHFALQVSPTAVMGGGTDHGDVPGYYLRKDAGLLHLGLWVGGVFAP